LAGFWGEMLAMLGSYQPASTLSRPLFVTLMAVAGVGTVLTAVYFLAMLRRVVFGIVSDSRREFVLGDVVATELAAWAPLVVLAVAIGVWPRLVLGVSEAAVRGLLR
jgi:NADH-quinone oxidoreductase subunit M